MDESKLLPRKEEAKSKQTGEQMGNTRMGARKREKKTEGKGDLNT
jgi:hypothetical protein